MNATSSERRLHPLSVVFGIGGLIRQMIFPAIAALFLGRDSAIPELMFLILGSLLLIEPVLRYVSFRYRFDEHDLVIRSGVVQRTERHIPYDRIQNVDAVQSIVHRALGVVSVNIQTGSGTGAEASLSAISVGALEEIRARVFAGTRTPSGEASAIAESRSVTETTETGRTILALRPADLMLAGLIESRGLFVVATILAYVSQAWDSDVGRRLVGWMPGLGAWAQRTESSVNGASVVALGIIGVAAFLVLLLVLRVLSAIWSVIRLYGFRVSQRGEDLRVEYGLLTRVVTTIPMRRIQYVVVDESPLHRMFRRAAVRVTTAGGGTATEAASAGRGVERQWLAPILPRAEVDALVALVQPGGGITLDAPLRPAHPRAFRRAITVDTVVVAALSTVLVPFIGWWALAVFAVLEARALIHARLLLRHLGWATTPTSVIFSGGSVRRYTASARFSRLQTVTYEESLFDRRSGMATVRVDTAGAGSHLSMRYLPEADAHALHAMLSGRASDTAFVW
jgi:putative membrane protein